MAAGGELGIRQTVSQMHLLVGVTENKARW